VPITNKLSLLMNSLPMWALTGGLESTHRTARKELGNAEKTWVRLYSIRWRTEYYRTNKTRNLSVANRSRSASSNSPSAWI